MNIPVNVLSLENVSKSYPGKNGSRVILKNVSFNIGKGDFVSILGASGCGKSTLLKICSSMLLPDSGRVKVFGTEVNHPDKKRILMLQDDNQLFPWLTVRKNIVFPLGNSPGLKRTESNIQSLLEMSGLKEYEGYFPHQLSGGMKKRASIARALAGDPDILLLDEPFGSLDVKIKKKLQEYLLKVWKKYRMTVLFVTHDIQEAIKLGQRIIIMNNSGDIVCNEENPLSKNSITSGDRFFDYYRKCYTIITDGQL